MRLPCRPTPSSVTEREYSAIDTTTTFSVRAGLLTMPHTCRRSQTSLEISGRALTNFMLIASTNPCPTAHLAEAIQYHPRRQT